MNEALRKYRTSAKGKAALRRAMKKYNFKITLKQYGLTIEQYNSILSTQGGRCRICGEENIQGHRLYVDHNHRTGKVRGLLCSGCNLGIGFFGESIVKMVKAIQYLLEDQFP
jgi:hypothetical protein